MGTLRQRREARQFRLADDLVRYEHITDAAVDQRLRFRDLLAADADRAMGDLALGDLRTLVRLRMRAHAHRTAFHRAGERAQIALESIQLEDQRRRVDVLDAIAYLRRGLVHAAA